MSEEIRTNIPSLKPQRQIHFAQNPYVPNNQSNTPTMQGQQTENPVMRMAQTGENPKEMGLTAALVPPMLIGLYKGMDVFARANSGAYNSSLSGRLANLGDRIATSRGARLVSPVFDFATRAWNYAVSKSPILTAMTKMPSVIENSFAKAQLHGTEEQLGQEFVSFVNKYLKNGGELADLAGLNNARFEVIQKALNSNDPVRVKKALRVITGICDRVKDTKSVRMDNWLGKITGRTVTLEQIGNQIKSITKPTTKLGRFLPKIGIRGMHGLTFGGGVFMILSALSLAQATVKTKKAEKGDKFKTFMEEFLGNISWVVTLPLGSRIMNAVQGWANIGLTPDKLAKYRSALKAFNGRTFANAAEWAAEFAKLQALRTPDKVGFFAKIARGIGRFLNTGREVVKPFMHANPTTFGQKLTNFFAKSKFFGRNALGYIIGLPIYMLIFAPIADKIFVKASHAIFGKPKHSRYDEEEKEKETVQQPVNNQTQVEQQPQQQIQVQPATNTTNSQNYDDTNLIKQHQNGNYPQTPKTPSGKDAEYEPVRRYIPSPIGMVPQTSVDRSALDAALAQADLAEKEILGVLNRKY